LIQNVFNSANHSPNKIGNPFNFFRLKKQEITSTSFYFNWSSVQLYNELLEKAPKNLCNFAIKKLPYA
jgi:hypothetical protein